MINSQGAHCGTDCAWNVLPYFISFFSSCIIVIEAKIEVVEEIRWTHAMHRTVECTVRHLVADKILEARHAVAQAVLACQSDATKWLPAKFVQVKNPPKQMRVCTSK